MSNNVDVMLKMLFESDQAVADVFNIVFGDGRRLVEPSMLRPASEREIALMRDASGKWLGRERTCDVARRIQWDDADPGNSLLLFIENQLNPHLLMPWRVKELHDMCTGVKSAPRESGFSVRKSRRTAWSSSAKWAGDSGLRGWSRLSSTGGRNPGRCRGSLPTCWSRLPSPSSTRLSHGCNTRCSFRRIFPGKCSRAVSKI